MVSYKFIYFNGRGLGELSRYIFAVASQDYEDYRVEYDEWLKLKNETIFGQLPMLIINDNGKETKLAQSFNIGRYLAREFGLAGKDNLTQAKAEMVLDHFVDLVAPFRDAVIEHDEVLREEKFRKFADLLPNHFLALERILETQNTPYLAGDELTGIFLTLNLIDSCVISFISYLSG